MCGQQTGKAKVLLLFDIVKDMELVLLWVWLEEDYKQKTMDFTWRIQGEEAFDKRVTILPTGICHLQNNNRSTEGPDACLSSCFRSF